MSDLADNFVAGFWTRAEALSRPLGDLACFSLVIVGCLTIVGAFAWVAGTAIFRLSEWQDKRL